MTLGKIAGRARRFEEGKAPDFGKVQERLYGLDDIATSTPAVIPTERGWAMFDDYYRIKRRKGWDDRKIITEWRNEASGAR